MVWGIAGIVLCSILIIGLFRVGNTSKEMTYDHYEGRVFYEIFVRAFQDSDGDGIGDLNGVTQKLDYLQELGIRGIWLMPIQKSSSYHGYDVEDYYAIEEDYGTMEDLRRLIDEAHKRDIKIVMDLVINHTSSEHQWFQEALKGEGAYRDYYIWTDDMTKEHEYSPMGTKGWAKSPTKEELYYAIFWKGMPDLNYDNPHVISQIKEIATYYLELGIDGFRLDAAKWLHDEKEKNIVFWNDFREHVEGVNPKAVLIGEVWDQAFNCKEYAGPLHSFFDFDLGEQIIKTLKSGRLSSVATSYISHYEMYKEQSESFVVAPFLTNHDQNRIMSMIDGDTDQMRMAAAMYLTLPGAPYVYYGEEIGMLGTKPDEMIREPFIWSTDLSKNTSWAPITNEIEVVALEKQIENEESLYHFYKKMIGLRNSQKALSRGDISLVKAPKSVFAIARAIEGEEIMVLINGGKEVEKVQIGEARYRVLLSTEDSYKEKSKMQQEVELQQNHILILKKE